MKPEGIFVVYTLSGVNSDDTEALISGFEENFEWEGAQLIWKCPTFAPLKWMGSCGRRRTFL